MVHGIGQQAEQLDPPFRLALAYAPAWARPVWLAFLLFEQRLVETAPPGRDPMMVQLRLAWWRDRLNEPSEKWPVSEPVLAHLKAWNGKHGALVGLVDGWEARIVGEDDGGELGRGRIAAIEALAQVLGTDPSGAVRTAAQDLAFPHDAPHPASPRILRLPRSMRPLAVLRFLARRDAAGGKPTPLADLAGVLRAGLLGW